MFFVCAIDGRHPHNTMKMKYFGWKVGGGLPPALPGFDLCCCCKFELIEAFILDTVNGKQTIFFSFKHRSVLWLLNVTEMLDKHLSGSFASQNYYIVYGFRSAHA